jgi:hypothetical protein
MESLEVGLQTGMRIVTLILIEFTLVKEQAVIDEPSFQEHNYTSVEMSKKLKKVIIILQIMHKK